MEEATSTSDDEEKCDSGREGDVVDGSGNERESEQNRERGRNADRSGIVAEMEEREEKS